MTADLNLFGKMPSAEIRLIKAVLDSDADVSMVIPDEVTGEQIMDQLGVLCRAVAQLELTRDKLLPVIGRLLILCQENPDVYLGKKEEYRDWRDFLRRCIYMKFGLSKSSAYFAMQVVRQWPRLSLKDYQQIGRAKMAVLNAIGSQNGMSSQKLINEAKARDSRSFREWAIKTGRLERGEDKGSFITVACSGSLRNQWERAIRNPKVIETVGSSSPAKILEAFLQEFMGTYGIGDDK